MNEGEDDRPVTLDPVFEARWWIEHALINFDTLRKKNEGYRIHLPKSSTMWAFEEYQKKSKAEEIQKLSEQQ